MIHSPKTPILGQALFMNRWRHWLWLVLVVPIAIGFSRLHFDVEVLDLLPGEIPVVDIGSEMTIDVLPGF